MRIIIFFYRKSYFKDPPSSFCQVAEALTKPSGARKDINYRYFHFSFGLVVY
jgi:hypothetical protein